MSAPASVPVGVQLYSLREEAAADFPAVLERLGAKGFIGVEFAGFYGHSPSDVARALDSSGLAAASAHVGLAEADQFAAALDDHAAVGCDTVVIPAAFEPGFGDLDKVKGTADLVNARERDRSRPRHHPRVPQPLLGAGAARRRPARAPALLRAPRPGRLRRGRHLLGADRRLGSGRDRDRARRARAGCCTSRTVPATIARARTCPSATA